ncbi:MAG: carboxypeptidase regulatory-like domain-containing protein [Acidobacteria bacterium]|nr:carboxypeptidase regulatory-like domain-containing protein [Acidobacteriota bacterium]
MNRPLRVLFGLASVTLLVAWVFTSTHAQQRAAVEIDTDDIGGAVTGPNGPEAGVWVIAETRDFQSRFIRSVVTDDQGRYVIPDLPKATYTVWARGYGLVDSDKTTSAPGRSLNITAKVARTPAEAAHYYPAIYWYSMLKIPDAGQFDGTQIPKGIDLQRWRYQMNNSGCIGCHQLGQLATRTIPSDFASLSSRDAWIRRVQSGQAGAQMMGQLTQLGPLSIQNFADWTDRIKNGELPFAQPPRPQGVERNVVITLRDWYYEDKYLHDLISSDRRSPTVNANGLLYGSPEYAGDEIPMLDPVKNTWTTFRVPVSEDAPLALGPGHAAGLDPAQPSAYWGNRRIWDTHVNNHNSMLDRQGRVWMTAADRDMNNPAYCKQGSDHPSAKAFPMERSTRQAAVLDPKTMKYTFLDLCFGTHHPQFGYDPNDTVWFSGGGQVLGWVNTKMWDQTHDVAKSSGWTPFVLDTNGNGKRDAYVGPDDPVDPTKDKRINAGFYAVMPSPADGSIWGTYWTNSGAVVRVVPGPNPPETAITEIYNVPLPGFGPRGGDIDRNGVVWVSLASGHFGSFDRRTCKGPLNGPKATGDHCPEGWTFHKFPGPGFRGLGDTSAESSYYSWVDQHNTLGLGENVPIATGNLNDGFIAYRNGQMIVLRVPYPIGFYAKGLDGRIDDPKAGWKGRGLWAANGDRTPWLIEGGKGTKPFAAHVQVRPNPLAH